jgi:hypothetical protein
VRLFCEFITDGRYRWGEECQKRFGTHPVQICHRWNTSAHLAEFEGRPGVRALTYDELERFFDACDERVERAKATGPKGAAAALRDSQMFKSMYAWGLRRAEVAGLDIADLRTNPHAPQWRPLGVIHVRHGKAKAGCPPQRRLVLSIPECDWAIEGLRLYPDDVRPLFGATAAEALWVTERKTRVGVRYIDKRFAESRDAAGLEPTFGSRCLRHSYLTEHATTAYHVRTFISWCKKRNLVNHDLEIPILGIETPIIPATSDDRWEKLQRLLQDDAIDLRSRVAGIFVVLYAQPISRLAILTTDAREETAGGTTISFGTTPVLLPPRIAELTKSLIATPAHAPIAATTPSKWLFPGRHPGQHILDNRLRTSLKKHGITARANRNVALIDLASEMPTPMIADVLGFNPRTTRRWNKLGQGDWTSYIARRTDEQFPPEYSRCAGLLTSRQRRSERQRVPRRSTTKTKVSLGAITPPAPAAPYPIAGGIVRRRRPPIFMPWTPSSQPAMTWL